MMSRRRLSFLTAAPLLFSLVAGCMMPTDETVEEDVAVAQQKDLPSATVVIQTLGTATLDAVASSLLGDSIGGAVVDLLLPGGDGNPTIDVQALVDAMNTLDYTITQDTLNQYSAYMSGAEADIANLKNEALRHV